MCHKSVKYTHHVGSFKLKMLKNPDPAGEVYDAPGPLDPLVGWGGVNPPDSRPFAFGVSILLPSAPPRFSMPSAFDPRRRAST